MSKQSSLKIGIVGLAANVLRKSSLLLVVLGLSVSGSVKAGDLAGKITASDGRPMPNVSIDIIGAVSEGDQRKMVVYSTKTIGGGSFTFQNLPDGAYRVCANKVGEQMLNPCAWGTKRYEVTVSSAQKTPDIEIPVSFGRPLRITVDDPDQALASSTAKKVPDSLVAFSVLDANGNEHEMRLDFEGKRTRDYVLIVPVDEPLQVIVNSFQADLKLAQGMQSKMPLTKNHHRMNVQVSSVEKLEHTLYLDLAKTAKDESVSRD